MNRVQGMPFKWSLNPYAGCAHHCSYCYAIAYRVKQDRPASSFHREVDVKINFADVLERELATRHYDGGVALGTATDPWQPCEGRYQLTRRTLAAIARSPLHLSIVTKSTMAVRDIDLLKRLAERGPETLTVCISIPTVTLDTWRTVEPRTPPPHKRLQLLERLRNLGIDAGVLCAPILPGITDDEVSLEAVARAANEHGATFFGWRPLKLDPGVKDFYLDFLATEFPVLVRGHEALYRNGAHAAREYQSALEARVELIQKRFAFGGRPRPGTRPRAGSVPRQGTPECGSPRQLALAM